jgi:hypothetical protein
MVNTKKLCAVILDTLGREIMVRTWATYLPLVISVSVGFMLLDCCGQHQDAVCCRLAHGWQGGRGECNNQMNQPYYC